MIRPTIRPEMTQTSTKYILNTTKQIITSLKIEPTKDLVNPILINTFSLPIIEINSTSTKIHETTTSTKIMKVITLPTFELDNSTITTQGKMPETTIVSSIIVDTQTLNDKNIITSTNLIATRQIVVTTVNNDVKDDVVNVGEFETFMVPSSTIETSIIPFHEINELVIKNDSIKSEAMSLEYKSLEEYDEDESSRENNEYESEVNDISDFDSDLILNLKSNTDSNENSILKRKKFKDKAIEAESTTSMGIDGTSRAFHVMSDYRINQHSSASYLSISFYINYFVSIIFSLLISF